MPYLTDLADAVRSSGLEVVEVPGWETRGHGPMVSASALVAHHTATSNAAPGDYPSLRVVRDGHSSLRGPLSQLGLGRSGKAYVIAAGLCYHAGRADNINYTNSRAIGIEAEDDGYGQMPDDQYDAYVRLCTALEKWYGLHPTRGHKEIAVPKGRKIDPVFDMGTFRKRIDATQLGGVRSGAQIDVDRDSIARFQRMLGAGDVIWRNGKTGDDDGVWGRETELQALAIRSYVRGQWGTDAPLGVRVRGWRLVYSEGQRRSMTATRRGIQWALGVDTDGIWGPQTDAAFKGFRKEATAL